MHYAKEAKELRQEVYDAVIAAELGTIKAIVSTRERFNQLLVMTTDDKFYFVFFSKVGEGGYEVRVLKNKPLTKEDVNESTVSHENRYIIENPECRIPNNIPNTENKLVSSGFLMY